MKKRILCAAIAAVMAFSAAGCSGSSFSADTEGKLTIPMTDSTTFAMGAPTGGPGEGGSGYANLTVESGSTWVVTGDSVLTNLANVGQIVDSQGRTVTIQNADGTIYVQGTSDVTVIVSSYTTQIDTTGASTVDSWNSYASA